MSASARSQRRVTIQNATAMRFEPPPMPGQTFCTDVRPQLRPLQPIGQPHDRLSNRNGSSELLGGVTIAVGLNRF